MSLIEAPFEKRLKIKEIDTEPSVRVKLHAMGLHIEDYLIKLNNNKWGPILLQNLSNGSTKIALGRTLAKNIIVEHE